MVTTITALAERTSDLSNNKVDVKSVVFFLSRCQKGEPNDDTTILNTFELLPESRFHLVIACITE